MVTGRAGKPSIIIDDRLRVWLGNESDQRLNLEATELCGFGTGSYEVRVANAHNRRDAAGIGWRVKNDLDLLVWNKSVIPVCRLLQRLATEQGIADVDIVCHTVSPKLRGAGTEAWCEFFSFLKGSLSSKL